MPSTRTLMSVETAFLSPQPRHDEIRISLLVVHSTEGASRSARSATTPGRGPLMAARVILDHTTDPNSRTASQPWSNVPDCRICGRHRLVSDGPMKFCAANPRTHQCGTKSYFGGMTGTWAGSTRDCDIANKVFRRPATVSAVLVPAWLCRPRTRQRLARNVCVPQ
ncbi:hypothetical protein BaRGS_00018316 [Batillaria attramentaria]|uniref:Uncharacterized protein n=2 Tax=Batillaria attramentaria TaxID=370345 RepID=A0ABD0KTL5_9CAEN